MKRYIVRTFAVVATVMFLSITFMELAHARAGGSRSSGSRGSRSYSSPATKYSQPSQPRQQAAPAPSPFQQQAGGGFMRSMAGGLMGGMLGSMLFSSFAGAGSGMGGMGGGMGGGIGLFEIVLLAGLGYLLYRFIKKKRAESSSLAFAPGGSAQGTLTLPAAAYQAHEPASLEAGLSHVRQMDSSFDQHHFNDLVMDVFFKVQAAWMNRDLSPVSGLLTSEMTRILGEDVDRMLKDKQSNRLESIAVRKVEILEVWQESGQDYITVSIYANLLDYTTDDTTGTVVAGSKTDPVKFEEYWTFTRPVGNYPWRLSSIAQETVQAG